MEDSKEKLMDLTVFQKGERGITVKGTVDLTGPTYMTVIDELGSHSFKKETLSALILDKPEDVDVKKYMDIPKKGYRVFTDSGTQLQFNGWDVMGSEVKKTFPEAEFAYLTDHDDLVIIFEEQKYHYHGEVFPEKPVEQKPAGPVPPKGKGPQPPKAKRT